MNHLLADDLLGMSSLIFSKMYKEPQKMFSAAVMISALSCQAKFIADDIYFYFF